LCGSGGLHGCGDVEDLVGAQRAHPLGLAVSAAVVREHRMAVALERVSDRGHRTVPSMRREPVYDHDGRPPTAHLTQVGGQAPSIRGRQRERL
jgi:hypothetical protein